MKRKWYNNGRKNEKENDIMDGKVGTYKGIDIYYCDVEEYLRNRKKLDNTDVMYLLTDRSDRIVYQGKVIGVLRDNMLAMTKTRVDIAQYYPKLSKRIENEQKTALAMGNPTDGTKHEVTSRRSVEWYMQHTIDVLNEGVKYGEEALRRVRAK